MPNKKLPTDLGFDHLMTEIKYSIKNTCPSCKRFIEGEDSQIFLEKMNECPSCDHVRGEIYD